MISQIIPSCLNIQQKEEKPAINQDDLMIIYSIRCNSSFNLCKQLLFEIQTWGFSNWNSKSRTRIILILRRSVVILLYIFVYLCLCLSDRVCLIQYYLKDIRNDVMVCSSFLPISLFIEGKQQNHLIQLIFHVH